MNFFCKVDNKYGEWLTAPNGRNTKYAAENVYNKQQTAIMDTSEKLMNVYYTINRVLYYLRQNPNHVQRWFFYIPFEFSMASHT